MNTGRTRFKKGQIGTMLGKKHTTASREKMRLAHLGHKPTIKTLEKMRGKIPWNKGMKGQYTQPPESVERRRLMMMGHETSEETKRKISEAHKGEKNHSWKGADVGISALHEWISNRYGRGRLCERCGTTTARQYDWSNNTGKYLRERSDWERLCRLCHVRKDRILFPENFKRKRN